jgi:hypothetical protein
MLRKQREVAHAATDNAMHECPNPNPSLSPTINRILNRPSIVHVFDLFVWGFGHAHITGNLKQKPPAKQANQTIAWIWLRCMVEILVKTFR